MRRLRSIRSKRQTKRLRSVCKTKKRVLKHKRKTQRNRGGVRRPVWLRGNNYNSNNNSNSSSNNSSSINTYANATPEERLMMDFISAIKRSDYDEVKRFIDEGIDVNGEEPFFEYTPLIRAVRHSTLPIIELLVDSGADIKKEVHTYSALSHADQRGDQAIFDYLMSKCEPGPCTFEKIEPDEEEIRPPPINTGIHNNNNNNGEWVGFNNRNNVNNNRGNNRNNRNNNNNNANEPRNVNNSLEIGQCYDPAMANNSANTKEFLRESKNNIVLVLREKAICLNRKAIKEYTKMFYECRNDTGSIRNENVITDVKYGKLMPYNQLISEPELRKFQNKEHIIFKLVEDRTAKAFVSATVRNRQGSFVSADHCQAGSGGKIYKVEGFTMEEGLQFLRNSS